MAEKTMLARDEVIALLQSDDAYWTALEAIRVRWDLPAAGLPANPLVTYFYDGAPAPAAQWEARWQRRASVQAGMELGRQVAQLNGGCGFPPLLDEWVVQHLLHGSGDEPQYTSVAVQGGAEAAQCVARGAGIYTDAGKLRQVNWTAHLPAAGPACRGLAYARLAAFDLAPHHGGAYEPPQSWVAPDADECRYLPWHWHCTGAAMQRGTVYQLQCRIELHWAVDPALLRAAQLGFELVQVAAPAVDLSTPLPAPPSPIAPVDDWFRWYHHVTGELGFRLTLKDLAERIGLSHNRVRHLHAEYQAEHGPAQR